MIHRAPETTNVTEKNVRNTRIPQHAWKPPRKSSTTHLTLHNHYVRQGNGSQTKRGSTWQSGGNTSLPEGGGGEKENNHRVLSNIFPPHTTSWLPPASPPLSSQTCWLPNGFYPFLHLYPHLSSDNTPVMPSDGVLWCALPACENCGKRKGSHCRWRYEGKKRIHRYKGRWRRRLAKNEKIDEEKKR